MVGSGEGHRHPASGFGQAQARGHRHQRVQPVRHVHADLLDHQDENTTVLPGFRNKGCSRASSSTSRPQVDTAKYTQRNSAGQPVPTRHPHRKATAMSGSVLVQQRATAAGSAIRVPKHATPKIVARKVSKLYPTPGFPQGLHHRPRRIRPDHPRRRVSVAARPEWLRQVDIPQYPCRTGQLQRRFGPPRR